MHINLLWNIIIKRVLLQILVLVLLQKQRLLKRGKIKRRWNSNVDKTDSLERFKENS